MSRGTNMYDIFQLFFFLNLVRYSFALLGMFVYVYVHFYCSFCIVLFFVLFCLFVSRVVCLIIGIDWIMHGLFSAIRTIKFLSHQQHQHEQ
jgi:hypothetical protein